MAKEYTVKLLRKEKLAKDTWLFALEKPKNYTFIPGQYQSITLTLPNGKTDWRDFTIASNPSEKELWMITKITKKPSEFKKQFLRLPLGSNITVQGGSGGFTIERNEKRPHVFIAGGIGLTVFRSILTAKEYRNLQAKLIVSFSSEENSIFQEELEEIARKHTKKQVMYHFTNKEGRLSKKNIEKYLPSIMDSIFMIAGAQEFVDAMNELFLQIGVPQENIRIDYFSGY